MDFLILLSLAVGPGLAIAYYVHFRDKFDKEPRKLLLQCFMLGVYSLFPAVVLEIIGESYYAYDATNLVSVFVYSFIIIGFSEEWSKYMFLRWFAYPKKAFNEPYDGIVYSVMIGMGFATFENIRYVFNDGGGVGLAFLRMFTAVPAHAIFGIMMGYFVGRAKFEKGNGFSLRMMGLFTAIMFHGGYDFFLLQQNYPVFYFGALVVVAVGIIVSQNAIHYHVMNSPFNRFKKGVKRIAGKLHLK